MRHPTLKENFNARGSIKTVGIVGMGYVGIPSAVIFASSPAIEKVYGIQRRSTRSGHKIDMLNQGQYPFSGVEPNIRDMLISAVEQKKFTCKDSALMLKYCDAIIIAIQTPFRDDGTPDFTALEEGLADVSRMMKKGTLVSIESTIAPGTTEGFAREILEHWSGYKAGREFGLVHAPERITPGHMIHNLTELDRIIGGIDPESTGRAVELYSTILTKGRPITMTATAAEVEKAAENAMRDLQIAAANELAILCEAAGVNFYDVRRGIASLEEPGITRAILYPGAGVGGHCLTKDTYHLIHGIMKIRESKQKRTSLTIADTSLYLLARRVNDLMPIHMLFLTTKALERVGKTINNSHIAMLGWAYAPDTDDDRNTPSEKFYRIASSMGAKVQIHDPFWSIDPKPNLLITAGKSLEETLSHANAAVLFTAHSVYQNLTPEGVYTLMQQKHPVIIDGRNIINPDPFIEKGFVYMGLGRGDKNDHDIQKHQKI